MKMAYLLALIVCLLFPLTASANDQAANSTSLKVRNREQAVQLVKRQYQDKVLKVQTTQLKNSSGYQVKLISNDGRIFYLFIDARTGSISRN